MNTYLFFNFSGAIVPPIADADGELPEEEEMLVLRPA
jgi:hypothetical protein